VTLPAEIQRLCDAMEESDRAGRYPRLTVEPPWSTHNPVLEGEFASPSAIRWYLERELGRLAARGARISVCPGREALDLRDPNLAAAVDETRWDLRRKKLFLFAPERMALSIDRLEHYTGTSAELFQRYVLLTNYSWHVEEFRAALPAAAGPDADGRQMPAWHHMLPGRDDREHRSRTVERQDAHRPPRRAAAGAGQQQSHETLNADPAPGTTSFPGARILIRPLSRKHILSCRHFARMAAKKLRDQVLTRTGVM
jgi:hypothetical protein